jgi:hypothetical protein
MQFCFWCLKGHCLSIYFTLTVGCPVRTLKIAADVPTGDLFESAIISCSLPGPVCGGLR